MSTTAIKERPILFSAPMVRALLDGRKTQTRRIVKPQPVDDPSASGPWVDDGPTPSGAGRTGHTLLVDECPYGVPGDRLWVKETLWRNGGYVADGPPSIAGSGKRAAIHTRRIDSRITLEVTGVRVERVQEVSVADAIAEGCSEDFHEKLDPCCPECTGDHYGAKWEFAGLWDSINGKGSWAANPWVWVVSFRRVR